VFPKRESPSIPSIRAVSWDVRFFLRAKIEHILLNCCSFVAMFSGICHDFCPAGDIIFCYFISQIYIVTLFEIVNKIK